MRYIPRRGFLRSYLRYIYPEIKTIHTVPSLSFRNDERRVNDVFLFFFLSKKEKLLGM